MELKNSKVKKKYNAKDRLAARNYYLLGLSICNVSKLTEVPIRTLQKWQKNEKWTDYKQADKLKCKIIELRNNGESLKKISLIFNISISSVWRYCSKK